LQTKLVARADISVPMSSSSFSSSVATEDFPAFDHTVMPVSMVPNWGAMHSPEIWNRSYADMRPEEFVPVPRYNLSSLTVPLNDLTNDDSAESVATVTAKLFYSTRFFGAYDLDSGEFEAVHPGVDLKLARGTPIGAIAGGRVQTVARNASMGLHVIIEHHLPDGTVMYSIYGHFDVALVEEGESVSPGTPVGVVGMTGNTSGPHVHLQVDTDNGTSPHKPYWPSDVPTRAEAAKFTVNPVIFIATYGK
jgi:murein DD-endopeptidase MepM/ murein hydrolase activator NlpD